MTPDPNDARRARLPDEDVGGQAPDVPAGASLTVTITASVPATTANGTVLRNVATVNGDQPEPTPDPQVDAQGTYRVNLGCVEGIDPWEVDVTDIDGRAF